VCAQVVVAALREQVGAKVEVIASDASFNTAAVAQVSCITPVTYMNESCHICERVMSPL